MLTDVTTFHLNDIHTQFRSAYDHHAFMQQRVSAYFQIETSGKAEETKKAQRAVAQVGTWVIPKSSTGGSSGHQNGHTHPDCEGRRPINPKPKAKRKRLTPLSVRTSGAQRHAIKSKALAFGLSVSQFLLRQALGHDLAPQKLSPKYSSLL